MPQHKSAFKRIRQSERQRQRNKRAKSMLRGTVKTFLAEKDKTAEKLALATQVVDKAAAKGVIHKNRAARVKSKLAKLTAQRSS